MPDKTATLSENAQQNRQAWDSYSKEYQKLHSPQLNRQDFVWGVWSIPESKLKVLGDVSSKKVLELGCGAAQLSIAIAKMGAHPVGIDNSKQQLEAAKKLLTKEKLNIPLYHCSAERTPFKEESFDLVFCDHGAMSFSPPTPTLKEVSRVLKTGGHFIFNMQSPIHEMCYNASTDKVDAQLHLNYFEMEKYQDPKSGMLSFQQSFSKWIRCFLSTGFEIVDLIELQAPKDGRSTYDFAELDWAEKWPAENIWKLRKT